MSKKIFFVKIEFLKVIKEKNTFLELLNLSNLGDRSADIRDRLAVLESMNGSPTEHYRRCIKLVMER